MLRKRDLAAAVAGNALEFYDFTTYAYFAIQIGDTFFPAKDAFTRLMLSLITFGGSFIMRPVGGAVIGRYADTVGRKPAMLFCFVVMGFSVLGVALTPSYASIGIAAPIIIVLLRLVQGFALGGDVGPTTSLLMEAAPPARRGLYGSLQFASQGLSTTFAGIAGVILANTLSAPQLTAFGWRIALGLGFVVVPIGFILRRNLPETLGAPERVTPIADTGVLRTAIAGLLIIMGSTTSFYVISFLSTYAQIVLHMRANIAFASTLIFGICNLVFSSLAGWLSDLWGRRPVMIWPRIILFVMTWPAFLLITRHPLRRASFGDGASWRSPRTGRRGALPPSPKAFMHAAAAQHDHGDDLCRRRRRFWRHDATDRDMAYAHNRRHARTRMVAHGDHGDVHRRASAAARDRAGQNREK